MSTAEYWAAEYDVHRYDDGVHPRPFDIAALRDYLAALAEAQDNLRAWAMVYQGELKLQVAAHYGLTFAEVDLPYNDWAALRDRYLAEVRDEHR